ncbi:uncharacterized protein [Canis lupus baileyi]|uniref:uncharacterized protein LOC102154048 isoform X2 n=1 Tax=Canis lupus familiaris TaxID=9615 RepID=UPI0015F1B525|nr:uncharacterized protein LOC102154048 isoform X2 [Canis lupus familiaris]XP_038417488.1 uncharacterized protein LOC102154048 isoform X2 [Canis lupus familiaris]XP_038526743.1 uncharacterized protein LOC102154048 isoform X2 [Canis lupus familiaris]
MNLLRRPPHRRPLWERSRETILPRSVPRPVRTATGGQSGFPREMGRRRVGSGEGSPGTVALTLGTSAESWVRRGSCCHLRGNAAEWKEHSLDSDRPAFWKAFLLSRY